MGNKFAYEKYDPRFRVGERQRGPSSTPSGEEGFSPTVFDGYQREWHPDL
jgi:hypothetical protein